MSRPIGTLGILLCWLEVPGIMFRCLLTSVCSHSYHLHLGSVVLYFWGHAVSHGYSSATTQWPLPAMQMWWWWWWCVRLECMTHSRRTLGLPCRRCASAWSRRLWWWLVRLARSSCISLSAMNVSPTSTWRQSASWGTEMRLFGVVTRLWNCALVAVTRSWLPVFSRRASFSYSRLPPAHLQPCTQSGNCMDAVLLLLLLLLLLLPFDNLYMGQLH